MTTSALPASPPGPPKVLQRTLFAAPAPGLPDELYAVAERGTLTRTRHGLVLPPGSRVTTQTYFGRFPAAYFQRWTAMTSIDVEVTLSGHARVEMRCSDAAGQSSVLEARVLNSPASQTVCMSTALDRWAQGGSLWIDIQSEDSAVTVQSLRWSTSKLGNGQPTAIVVCTHDRPQECLRTLRALAADAQVLELVEHVYVVDQGVDAVEGHPEFRHVTELFGAKLSYVRQLNLGGAGGFTRGLLEADGSNVLLMDDDIVLEPETVLRLTAFANQAVGTVIVGGQMLSLLRPERLHVGAEQADLRTLASARIVPGAVQDVDLMQVLPHARVDAGYNGWWCCLLSAEAVRACGLPLPYFIKWDDIEYGVRAARRGVATVTLPGAAVWHPDPSSKDTDDWSRYFSFRNALITSAVHGELSGWSAAAVLARDLAVCLAAMQYALAATLLKGVEDFLAGPDMLADGGVAALRTVRHLRSGYPDSVQHRHVGPESRLDADLAALPNEGQAPRFRVVPLVMRCASQLLGRTRRSTLLRAADASWWHVSSFRTAAIFGPAEQAVRIRTYDRAVFLRLSFRGILLLGKLAREADAVQDCWQRAAPGLTSRENWTRLFAQ